MRHFNDKGACCNASPILAAVQPAYGLLYRVESTPLVIFPQTPSLQPLSCAHLSADAEASPFFLTQIDELAIQDDGRVGGGPGYTACNQAVDTA